MDEEGVESVQSSVQRLKDKIPLINYRRADSSDSLDDVLDERTRNNIVETKTLNNGGGKGEFCITSLSRYITSELTSHSIYVYQKSRTKLFCYA